MHGEKAKRILFVISLGEASYSAAQTNPITHFEHALSGRRGDAIY